MGSTAENFGDIEWIDPVSHLPVHDDTLSAEIHNQVPGVLGNKISFRPLIEGRRSDGTPVHAFFMHDPNGQPLVGIREVPKRSEKD